MDLRLPAVAPSDADRAAVDAVLGSRSTRDLLLPALHAVQRRSGWISPGALAHICERLTVPPAEAYGVATFYALLATEERPPVVVHVCDDLACRLVGAESVIGDLGSLGATGEGWTWKRSPCLGQCERGPAALLQRAGEGAQDVVLTGASAGSIVRAAVGGADVMPPRSDVAAELRASVPQAGQPGLRLLRRVGAVDPTSYDAYRAQGGFAALRRTLELGPEAVIREVKGSRIVGRGGAAFPMGQKWEAVALATALPHYVICNADESEPGTFKDRILMEEDPFALLEAVTIAGLATGAEQGYIYIRGEYPLALARVRGATLQAREQGMLGANVMGSGWRFDLEVREGAGAYICGEETALINSVEGKRGEPRNKPPFPTTHGLFSKPTVVNNVETLLNVLDIVLEGSAAFAARGTAGSTGTKLFSVSGSVQRPGLYEVPFGTTLQELLDLCGGVGAGRTLRAVLLGGAAGTFLRPDETAVPLTFEGTRAIGAALGSGAVLVFDDSVDLRGVLLRIAAFFRDESCGQCVPCRIGTVRQEESLRSLAAGGPAASGAQLTRLDEIARVMRDASICGLGQTASSAIQSALLKLGVFAPRTLP